MIVSSIKKAKNSINQVGATVNKPFSFMPFILLIIAAIFFLPGIIRKWKNKKGLSDINNAGGVASTPAINSSYVNTVNLAVAARSLYDAIWNNDWFGWTEDEDAIMEVLRTIPDKDIMGVAKEYEKINEKKGNMVDHILKYCSVDDLKKEGLYNKINRL